VNINLTLIGQSLTFIAFIIFTMKFVWPFLIQAMKEREQRIAEGLEAAERADKDLELAKQKAAAELSAAKHKAAEIVEQANKRSAQIIEEAKQKAIEEADRKKAASEAELQQEINRAREELRRKVVTLSISGAEKVLGSEIDASVHSAMLDKLAAEL